MIAIITARGGSKRLPRKNVLPFCGRPLIAFTIEAARQSTAIDRVVVSTDDAEIAAVSLEAGAEVPFMRPAELASDTASSRDVLLHALQFIEAEGTQADSVCLLQPTSPLRTGADIDGAVELFARRRADSVVGVVTYQHPIQWALSLDADGRMVPRDHGSELQPQDLIEYYRPNGAMYLFRTEFLRNSLSVFGANSYGYVMPRERSIDIDTQLDFLTAEMVARYLGGRAHA